MDLGVEDFSVEDLGVEETYESMCLSGGSRARGLVISSASLGEADDILLLLLSVLVLLLSEVLELSSAVLGMA